MTRPKCHIRCSSARKIQQLGTQVHWGRRKGYYNICGARRWDHLQEELRVVHKTVGMGGRRFRHLPRHSAFGLRRSGDAGGRRDKLVLEGAEGDRGASSESEYVALAKVVKELRFLREVKGFLTPRSTTKL